MSFAQPRTIRTISAAASGVPSPKFVVSTLLPMCCSMTQLSVSFIRTSASAIGRSLREHGCGSCCPGSGFFGPQSSVAIVAAVQGFAVWCGTTACVHVPIHSRSTAGPFGAPNGCNVSVWPAAGARLRPPAQHSWPCVSPVSADRCTLHLDPRNLPFVCVNSNWRVDPQQQSVCSSVLVCSSGESVKPRGCFRESTCQRRASCLPSVLCTECHLHAHLAHVVNMSRTYKRKSSVHAVVSTNAARFPANSTLTFRRCPGVSRSSTACSLPS